MRDKAHQMRISRFIPALWVIVWLFVMPVPEAVSGPSAVTKSGITEETFLPEGDNVRVEVWLDNLNIPWSLIFLPDGRALISERPGWIRVVKDGVIQGKPYAEPGAVHYGEGGLMGLALHPEFPREPYIYAMHTYRKEGELYNRVVRLRDLGDRGIIDRVIIDEIPGGRNHNGGRIAFGPDGMLYITTGETFRAELAQNLNSLGGKILRVSPEGAVPEDNPFPGSPIYSYGHRNPQGLTWHPETKDLFASEHGPSGEFFKRALDEINVIKKGGNYGWPEIIGRGGKEPYVDPLVLWTKTTPPAGITFYREGLFVATLRSNALIRIKLRRSGGSFYTVEGIERWFAEDYSKGKFGRTRDVVVGPDGFLYFLTSNRDGRGWVRTSDDKVYRIRMQE
jgi:quinoprotein glucose dehydrogenase